MLAYTLNTLLTQTAEIQRDQAVPDAFGAEGAVDWQTLSIPQCAMWWWKESSRGPAREIATPQRTIAESEGGMLLPPGTDITPEDQIAQILNADGTLAAAGPLDVIAVFPYETHVQLAWKRSGG